MIEGTGAPRPLGPLVLVGEPSAQVCVDGACELPGAPQERVETVTVNLGLRAT